MSTFSRWHTTEERISELEDISIEISKTEKQREKKMENKTEKNIQEMWDNYKKCNIHVRGIPEREKGTEYLKQ